MTDVMIFILDSRFLAAMLLPISDGVLMIRL
jgi:hypothetical protein